MDFYVVLGVERTASLNDIKRAFKRLARKYHPDINPGDRMAVAQFREISEAYETLSDPDRRKRYDLAGEVVVTSSATFGFEGFDFTAGAAGSAGSTFGDLFADLLQQNAGGPDRAPARGADLHHSLKVGFAEAMRGGQHTVTVTRQEHCRSCKGLGRLHVAESRCRALPGRRRCEVRPQPYGVLEAMCALWWVRAAAEVRCPNCAGGQTETRAEPLTMTCRRVWPMACAFAWPARARWPQRRRERRSVFHRPRGIASALYARRGRSTSCRAHCRP